MQKIEYKLMFKSEEVLWWYQGLRDILLWSIQKFGKKNPRILDAGCGTGKTIEFLKSKNYKVDGFDHSSEAIAFCKKRGISIKQGEITKIPYKNSTYDIVICLDVIGELKNDKQLQKAVAEFHRILKPKGILILQCAALESLRSQHDAVVQTVKRFSLKELLEFFPDKNWVVKKVSYRIFLLFPLVFLFKLIKKISQNPRKEASSDQYIPPAPVNDLLTAIQLLENRLFRFLNFPIGSSLYMICRKK